MGRNIKKSLVNKHIVLETNIIKTMANQFHGIEEEDGNKEGQIARFEELLKANATVFFDLDVYEEIIQHYIDKNDLSKAFKACELACETYPYSASPIFLKAQVLTYSGQFSEAIRYVEKIEGLQPNDMEMLVLKANIYAAMKKYKLAIEYGEKILQFHPTLVQMHQFIAQNYLRINDYEKSFDYYTKAISIDIEEDLIFDSFLDFIEMTSFHKKAIEFFEKLIDNEPYSAIAWFRLGVVANAKADYAKALHALDYSTLIKEDYADAWAEMACVYMNQKKYEEAKQTFEKVLLLEEPTTEIYCHLGASMEKLKDYEQAIKAYRKAVDLKDSNNDGWYGIASCLMLQGNHFQAIHYLKKAIKLRKNEGEYWLALADCEFQVGNIVSCLEAYKTANDCDPMNPKIWLDWSYVFYDQGNYDKAIELISSATDDMPEDIDLLYRLVAYLIAAGKYKQAFGHLESALILDFDKHTVLFDFFENNEIRKALFKIINQFREKD